MISDILLSWNELTATLVIWLGLVSLAVGVDFGPEIHRERKARATIMEGLAKEQEALRIYREAKLKQIHGEDLFLIQPATVQKRRHARV